MYSWGTNATYPGFLMSRSTCGLKISTFRISWYFGHWFFTVSTLYLHKIIHTCIKKYWTYQNTPLTLLFWNICWNSSECRYFVFQRWFSLYWSQSDRVTSVRRLEIRIVSRVCVCVCNIFWMGMIRRKCSWFTNIIIYR